MLKLKKRNIWLASGVVLLVSVVLMLAREIYLDSQFETWGTVEVGGLESHHDVFRRLDEAGVNVDVDAWRIIEVLEHRRQSKQTLALVNVSVYDLGLENNATTVEIYAAARAEGLRLCSPELALQIWLKQPELKPYSAGSLMIAMEPVSSYVFQIRHDGSGPHIEAKWIQYEKEWHRFVDWIFCAEHESN